LSGLVPYVSRVTGYDPNHLDMTRFTPSVNDWGTMHLIPDMIPLLLVEGDGPPTKKN
jgi:hypothetical protein